MNARAHLTCFCSFGWSRRPAHDAIHREGFPNLDGTKHAWAACYLQMCLEVCLVGGSMSFQGGTKHHNNTITKQISFSFIRFLKSFKDV